MFSSVYSWMEWGNKPYRSTDMPLENENIPDDAERTNEEAAAACESSPETPKTETTEQAPTDVPVQETVETEAAASSWWDYANISQIDINKIKESAQNIDYKKLSDKIGQSVNKESVTMATKGLGTYLNTVYGGIKTSVESLQKEGIPMLTEFDEEQKKFMKMQQRREGAAVPPWVGYNEETKMKKQILSLSGDERNVLRDPPAGVDFVFDFNSNLPVATAVLEADPKLNDLRFKLVPKVIKEDQFWRNYFYRVSLIKQSAQLTSLEKSPEASYPAAPSTDEPTKVASPQEDQDFSFSLQDDEFISDHLSGFEDAQDELSESELQQIGLKKDPNDEWEKELAQELQEFDMLDDASKLDTENFEAELEEMLQHQQ